MFDIEEIDFRPTIFDIGGIDNEDDLDFELFDIEGKDDNQFTRYMRPSLYHIPPKTVRYEHAAQLAEDIKWDSMAPRYDVFVSGNFIFGDFIEAFLVKNNCKATHMTIATLSLSEANIESLHDLMKNGYIDELSLIVSAYFYSHERRYLMPLIYKKLDIDNRLQVTVAGIHTKTCSFVTLGGKKIVIHGSANLRSSSNIELFTIEQNDEVYDFYEETYQKLVDKYKTINKPVRSKESWDAMEKRLIGSLHNKTENT